MTFVIADGQLQSLDRPVVPAIPTGIQLAANEFASYERMWRTQPQLRTVIGFLARNIAQLGLHVFDRVSDTDRQRLRDHPLAKLLDQPLPPQFKMTRYRLINALVSDLGLYDNAYWVKLKMTGGARGLVRLPPRQVTPIGSAFYAPEAYRVTGNVGRQDIPADQVVHFFGYNPHDPRHGVSPIESLRQILAEDFSASQARAQMWRNGARVSGYLSRPKDAKEWSVDARNRFREQWRSQYTGDGSQAGGTPILEDGMSFESASMTPDEAQYLGARKLTREEVAAAYYIPPPMVGILDNATFSNITEQHKMLYQDTLGPWLEMIQEDVELQLLPDLDPTPTVYVEFNIGDKLKGSFEEQAASIQSLVGAPVLTRDEGRALLNRNAMGGVAAELVTPLNVLIGGQASPQDSGSQNRGKASAKAVSPPVRAVKTRAPDAYQTRAEQSLKAFFARQRKAVLASLGSKAAADWWDEDRWNSELSDTLFALGQLVSEQVGVETAKSLGFDASDYDVDRTLHFLRAVADSWASNINAATQSQIADVLASADSDQSPDDVFDNARDQRAVAASAALVTAYSGFGTTEAARQVSGGRAMKTWITGPNPRPAHAAMNGETVGIDELFSNGLNWPGDGGDADEVAGCNCGTEITIP